MNRRNGLFIAVALGALLALALSMDAKAETPSPPSCGEGQKEAEAQRRKGAESFPPLPLPATPLRRTERKRPPAPPALIGKLEYGQIVWATDSGGRRFSYRDWTTDPLDIINLMKLTNDALDMRYRSVNTSFEEFSYKPDELPILYLTGHEAVSLTEEQRANLRWYLNDGGYLIADACCGSEPFWKSFLEEMRAIFPQRKLYQLQPDHPVFLSYYQIGDVVHIEDGQESAKRPPTLWGINIGCRTAIFLTTYDLSCGWDGHSHPTGNRIGVEDARRLGVNLLTYCLAHYKLGRFLSTQKRYYQETDHTRDQFVFGQVLHDGDWDPAPNGVMALMKHVATHSTMDVQFKREEVDLRQAAALQHPMLYMTGHHEINLSEAEVLGLRNYLRNGGILVADSCCGRDAFDRSFRELMGKALPGIPLETIPLGHPLYHSRTRLTTAEYSDRLRHLRPELTQPTLEGITLNGQLAVIYSRYGLGTCWDGQFRPYALCYSNEDALNLGLNILVYAMTH